MMLAFLTTLFPPTNPIGALHAPLVALVPPPSSHTALTGTSHAPGCAGQGTCRRAEL